jgi:hypothetical protein
MHLAPYVKKGISDVRSHEFPQFSSVISLGIVANS